MPVGSVLLDGFNRADGGPGANWGAAVSTYSLPNIVSNELNWPQFPSAMWQPAMEHREQYVWCELSGTADAVHLLLRWTNPNSGIEAGYAVHGAFGGLGPAEAFRWESGAATSMGFENGVMDASDTFMLAEATGGSPTTLNIYGSSDGTSWNLRKTWQDSVSPHVGAGRIGIFHPNNSSGGTINQFGGEAVVPPPVTTLDVSRFPKFPLAGGRPL